MLNLTKDRLDYGTLLTPPEGYNLTKAIGTTYSLDLFSLMAIPVAMFYSKSLEGDFKQNRYDILDAIRQSKEKVKIFCQRGKIASPDSYSNLFSFMEDCVIEVTPPEFNASFHPKIWVIRFEKENEVIYRLIVLSRNLTFDRSWDVAFYSDGKVTEKKQDSNESLKSYLDYFMKYTNSKEEPSFFEDLSNVKFDLPNGFTNLELYPILGFEDNISKFPNPLNKEKYKQFLIISPFVQIKVLNEFKKLNNFITLFSRKEELDKLYAQEGGKKCLKGIESYAMSNVAVEGEKLETQEESYGDYKNQNLHAKIFIGSNDSDSHVYLGSANSTNPAFDRNAEFMVKLSSENSQMKARSMKKYLLDSNLFVPFVPNPEFTIEDSEEAPSQLLRMYEHLVSSIEFNGRLDKRANNENFDLIIDLDLKDKPEQKGFKSKFHILGRESEKKEVEFGINKPYVFANIALTNVSTYVVITNYYESSIASRFTVKMNIEIPAERESRIFSKLIDNKTKFYQYLQFVLTPEEFKSSLEILSHEGTYETHEDRGLSNLLIGGESIYEALMIAASRNPSKLKEIEGIVAKLQHLEDGEENEALKEFLPIWSVFKEFIHE